MCESGGLVTHQKKMNKHLTVADILANPPAGWHQILNPFLPDFWRSNNNFLRFFIYFTTNSEIWVQILVESYIIIKITKTNRERKQATAHVCKRIHGYVWSPMTIRKGAVNFRIIVFHQLPDAIFGCSSISCLIKLSYCLFASTNWFRKLISTFSYVYYKPKEQKLRENCLKKYSTMSYDS